MSSDAKTGEVRRPVLRWHGGKWKLAPWIIQHFPKHRIYVEPYGGAASVLMRKPRSYAEVYNDLDDGIVNLMKVLRDEKNATRLRELLFLTPFSRTEWKAAYKKTKDPVELARQLVIISYMGFGSNAHNRYPTGFRANSNRSGTTPAVDWKNFPDAIPAMVDRLRGVVIENRDALEVMKAHDGEDTLHYVDPPYVHETRDMMKNSGKRRGYTFEMDDGDHENMLDFLLDLEGMVVLSGYANPIYEKALTGWKCVECKTHADGGLDRVECLWLNPRAQTVPTQGTLMAI